MKFFRMFALLSCWALLFSACDTFIAKDEIGRIVGDPATYQDRKVTVKGTVVEAVSILSVGYYLLRDESGEIAVLPEGAAPPVGSTVTASGRVRSVFTFGDRTMLVLEQWSKDRKEGKGNNRK